MLLCGALMVAGCGARWSDEERASVFARHESGPTTTPISDDGPSGVDVVMGTPTDATSSDVTVPSGGPSGGPTADPGGGGAGGPLPCAAPSNAPGLTADEITVGNISTLTGPVPGLGATAQTATRAYVAFRNATGGVCGRQVRLLTADDGNDGGRARTLAADMVPRVLALVGSFSPALGSAPEILEQAKVPIVGSAGDPSLRSVSTVFNINPPPADLDVAIGKFRYLREQGVRTAAIATLSAAAAILELEQHEAQIKAAGIQIVSKQLLPITTLSFDSAARTVANSKADYLFFLGAAQHDAAMARSMRDSGYTPKFEEYLTGYGSNYTELAGAAAEGTSSWIRSLPLDDGGSNAAQRTYLEWLERAAPGAQPDVFATDAWAASKAFFESLEQLPGPITRAAVVAQLRTLTNYDADGLFGPIDLGHSKSKGCLVGLRFTAGKWQRITPKEGFLC